MNTTNPASRYTEIWDRGRVQCSGEEGSARQTGIKKSKKVKLSHEGKSGLAMGRMGKN